MNEGDIKRLLIRLWVDAVTETAEVNAREGTLTINSARLHTLATDSRSMLAMSAAGHQFIVKVLAKFSGAFWD